MMTMAPVLSIVVAVKDGVANVPALLAALEDRGQDVEIIFACAGSVPDEAAGDSVSTFALPSETLVPALWSEGIARARGDRVALTTAQFVPDNSWLARLVEADLKRWVGIGGAIDNDPGSSFHNWAIFFLRYSAFAPPLTAGKTEEIAADNAIYDRAAILAHPDLLAQGFWEPSFHRRFHVDGRNLALDPGLVVVHHGTVSVRNFARQRHLHGRVYGIERAQRSGLGRNLLLLLSSPLVPPLLLARIVARVARRPRFRGKLFPSLPWLLRFTFAWGSGEAIGYASMLRQRMGAGRPMQPEGHM